MKSPGRRALRIQRKAIKKLIELSNDGNIHAYKALLRIKDERQEIVNSVKKEMDEESQGRSNKRGRGSTASATVNARVVNVADVNQGDKRISRRKRKMLRSVECKVCGRLIPRGAMMKHIEHRHRHLYYRYYGSSSTKSGRSPSVPDSFTGEDIYDVGRVCQGGAPGLGKKK